MTSEKWVQAVPPLDIYKQLDLNRISLKVELVPGSWFHSGTCPQGTREHQVEPGAV